MTTMINGHTIPVDDMDHAEKLSVIADALEGDVLEQWLYAGAPLAGTIRVQNNAYNSLVRFCDGKLVGVVSDGPSCDCNALVTSIADGGTWDVVEWEYTSDLLEMMSHCESANPIAQAIEVYGSAQGFIEDAR
jgi:hypothetical protein